MTILWKATAKTRRPLLLENAAKTERKQLKSKENFDEMKAESLHSSMHSTP